MQNIKNQEVREIRKTDPEKRVAPLSPSGRLMDSLPDRSRDQDTILGVISTTGDGNDSGSSGSLRANSSNNMMNGNELKKDITFVGRTDRQTASKVTVNGIDMMVLQRIRKEEKMKESKQEKKNSTKKKKNDVRQVTPSVNKSNNISNYFVKKKQTEEQTEKHEDYIESNMEDNQ